MPMWVVLILVGLLMAPMDARAQSCAGIADPALRLECYDRARGGAPARQAVPGQAQGQGNCTPAAPCVGPRGGRYYFTASGAKRYLSR